VGVRQAYIIFVAAAMKDECLVDYQVFHIPSDRWAEIEALIDTPVVPNSGLVDLFSKPSVFVERV